MAYPAHVDCHPGLLYTMHGHRKIRMFDLKRALLNHPEFLQKYTELSWLGLSTEFSELEGFLYEVELGPGDVLYTPIF
eukprot:SAG31_NODE_40416_length_281_cov_0.571429_1_plen_77_part_10